MLDASQRREQLPNGVSQIRRLCFSGGKSLLQNLASLGLHGPAMPRGPQAQPHLGGEVQLPNRHASHVAMISLMALIAEGRGTPQGRL